MPLTKSQIAELESTAEETVYFYEVDGDPLSGEDGIRIQAKPKVCAISI